MKKLIILNHKMSLLYDDLYNYIDRTNNIETDNDIIICPSNIYLEAFINNSVWPIGAQNMHYSLDEKHTGEISTDQLKSLDILYSLIGHYERVREFNENKNIINEKLIAALDANIIPILCFGEDIDEDYKEVIPNLLNSYLKNIMNIAYRVRDMQIAGTLSMALFGVVLVFGIMNCVLGYRLLRFWMMIFGFLIGAGIGLF